MMFMRASDPLIAPPRTTLNQALEAVHPIMYPDGIRPAHTTELDRYVTEVYRYAVDLGLDPTNIIAQAALETANWGAMDPKAAGAIAWRERNNPASIGITSIGEGQLDHDLGLSWTDVTDAARAHVAHVATYAGIPVTPAVRALNPRIDVVTASGWFGVAKSLDDLSLRYAMVPDYGERIANRGNWLFGFEEEQPSMVTIPTTHSVPTPTIYNLATDYARFGLEKWQADEIIGSRFTNRNGGRPEFIVLHIQDGITTGSLDYWSSAVVEASSTVMIQKDGSILRILPEKHGPWTNGDISSPTAEAAEILAMGGNPNNWSLTLEAEGRPADGLTPPQFDAIVWQVEDWIIRYPHILGHVWSMLRHRFINSQTRWRCPDEGSNTQSVYFAPVVAAINAWLEGAPVEEPKPPVIVPPDDPGTTEPPESPYPKGMSEELAKRLYGRVKVPWFSGEFVFNPNRSECQYWLARGQRNLKAGEDYTAGEWPELDDVIRRGKTKNIHVYRWNNGDVYEKVIRKDR